MWSSPLFYRLSRNVRKNSSNRQEHSASSTPATTWGRWLKSSQNLSLIHISLTFVSRLYSLEGVPTDTIVKKWQPVIEDAMKGSATWSYTNLALCLEAGVLTQAELQELTAEGQINGAASREDLAVYLTRAMQLAPVAATLRTYSDVYKRQGERG